jgi:hypothetical protein
MAFDDETNGWLAPLFCMSGFEILFVKSSGNGTLALTLTGPFYDESQYRLLPWVFMKQSINQTIPIWCGLDAFGSRFFFLVKLIIGVASNSHSRLL